MPGLKIYGIARTRAFRALWIAKELGLDYEHLPIEIGVQIPTHSSQVFRSDAGRDSDLKPATIPN